MSGHVRKRKRGDGSPAWQVRLPGHASKTFDRRKDAQRWLSDRQAAALRGDLISPEMQAVTFDELVTDWRAGWDGRLQPRTVERYDEILRRHLLPQFAGMRAIDITMVGIQRHLDGLRPELAPGTVRKVHAVLSAVFAEGLRMGTVRMNPARGVRLPRQGVTEPTFLTPAQVEALADTAGVLGPPGGRQAALAVRLAAYTGLRAGEQWGLRVGDVDLGSRRIRVTRALKSINGRLEFGPTKTHQSRSVVFPRMLVPALTTQLASRGDGVLFAGAYGSPIRHGLFIGRAFRPALKLCELDGVRWHDLRHTYASLAAMAGASAKDVQTQLGHASITMTLDRYTHLFPSQADSLADRLDGLIGYDGREKDANGSATVATTQEASSDLGSPT